MSTSKRQLQGRRLAASWGPSSPSRPIEAVKLEGWQSQRILVVSEDDRRLDITERQFIRRLGERHYGAKENWHG